MALHKKAALKILIQKLCLQTWRSICLFFCHSELQSRLKWLPTTKYTLIKSLSAVFFFFWHIAMIPIIFAIRLLNQILQSCLDFLCLPWSSIAVFFLLSLQNLISLSYLGRWRPNQKSQATHPSHSRFKIYAHCLGKFSCTLQRDWILD